jgi:hypothetical protein
MITAQSVVIIINFQKALDHRNLYWVSCFSLLFFIVLFLNWSGVSRFSGGCLEGGGGGCGGTSSASYLGASSSCGFALVLLTGRLLRSLSAVAS